MMARRRWTSSASPAADVQAPAPSGPRCASAAPSARATSVESASGRPAETTPAMPHIRNLENLRGDLDRVVRLDFVFEAQADLAHLAVGHDAVGLDPAIRSAIGQPAGKRDGLLDGHPGLEDQRA